MRILFLFFTFPVFSLILSCAREESVAPERISGEPVVTQEISLKYGIPVDSFRVKEGKIKSNQFLGDLLGLYKVPYPWIEEARIKAKQVFDIRTMKAGNPYTAFCSTDSAQTLRYFVYEHSPAEYLVFDFSHSVNVYRETREMCNIHKTASGEITTSLWESITQNGTNPMIAIHLSEIFAWSIDFFGLQAGDRFRVIYEESFVDTLSTGIVRIHGAWFQHMGENFYAIPFEQDSTEQFFDQYGNSLRKAFLKAPLRFSRISSRFSNSRLHPILKIRRPHFGVDYAAPVGTPVYAIGDGRIMQASYEGDAGRMVKIRHNSVYATAYLHLSRFAPGITTGTYVRQGQVIGYVGSTGLSTGPHLDFRFYRNGSPVDPLKVESPSVEPVKPEKRHAFNQKLELMRGLLDTL